MSFQMIKKAFGFVILGSIVFIILNFNLKLISFEAFKTVIGVHVSEENKNNYINFSCVSAFKDISLEKNVNIDVSTQLKCAERDWVLIDDTGRFLFDEKVLKELNITIDECVYSNIKWKSTDFDYFMSEEVKVKNGDLVNLNEEFFVVKCNSKDTRKYESAFAKIFAKFNESSIVNKEPLNVLFLGFDSVSRLDFFNSLPSTASFIKNELKSTILLRYNIVGDGTPAALVPLLTSKHESELPNTIRGTKDAMSVDEAYPFIWKNFSQLLNYSTLFGEDWPQIGTFQYRMNGMKKPPTDHYMRQFFMGRSAALSNKKCIGGRTNIKFYFDYIKDFARTYRRKGYFGFVFLNEYSHDGNSRLLSSVDLEFTSFFKEFQQNVEVFGNTILVVFADHGPRYSHLRKHVQGLLNERNPFFSIYLPKKFQEKYPNEFVNFKSNSDKLITPMDIHRTFINLIDLETGKVNEKIRQWMKNEQRSASLFEPISYSRTCNQAGISEHWCACLKRRELNLTMHSDQRIVNSLAEFFINYVNNEILKNNLNECERLSLSRVEKVYLLESYIDTKPKSTPKPDPRFLQEPRIEKDYKKYFVQLETSPNNGSYEATVVAEIHLENGLHEFKVDKDEISRINKYGSDPQCIYEKFPDLRKYCFCKNKIL